MVKSNIKENPTRKKPKFIDNETFVHERFEWLVDNFGGRRIVICNGKIFTGKEAVKEARKEFPKTPLRLMCIPRPEFFSSHFLL